ncbi:hypothetical protein Bca4012_041066 [Brassica carinata]
MPDSILVRFLLHGNNSTESERSLLFVSISRLHFQFLSKKKIFFLYFGDLLPPLSLSLLSGFIKISFPWRQRIQSTRLV